MIKRQIYLTKKRRIEPLNVVYGSKLPIEFEIMDYTLPSSATIKAYAKGVNSEKVYVVNCSKSGSKITFTPVSGFFRPGYNSLQVEIVSGNDPVITFVVDTQCDPELSAGSDPATPEEVIPYVTRAEQAATSAEQSANAANTYKNSAQSYMNNAATQAQNAGNSAGQAASSASAADKSARAAKDSAAQAEAYKNDALNSSNRANAFADEALQSKNAAEQSATAAQKSKDDAAALLQSTTEQANKAEVAAARAEEVKNSLPDDYLTLIARLKSGAIEDAEFHLGFYLDADGDLCQKED